MSEPIVQLNEEIVKSELKELVRNSVEETLNALLNKESEELTNAAKYERTESRQGYRSGHYSRKLTTTSGEVTLNIPKLKGVPFETAIIERYRCRESSVEEALIEMYLAGVSVRRVEDISEALWGNRVSASTISGLNQKAQRCTVHFYRNVFSVTPRKHTREVSRMLKAIHAQESKEAARKKAKDVVEQLRAMKLKEEAKKVRTGLRKR